MKHLASLAVAVLVCVSCSASSTVVPNEAATTSPATSEAEPTIAPLPTPAPPVNVDPQNASQLSNPVPSDVELNLARIPVPATTYALTFDKGTQWEIPIVIAAPEGWGFDPSLPGFSDGTSSIALIADCAGPCEIKAWDNLLRADGAFFDEGSNLFPDGAMGGGSGGSSENDEYSGTFAMSDDGSGISLTAHSRHDAGRFVGCTAIAAPGSFPVDLLRELCEAIEIDWSTASASTPAYVITERLTDEAATAIADPAPGLERQTFSIDDDGMVTIALPADSTVDDDGEGVTLGNAESIFTDMELDATCDGTCGPQDWGTKLQEVRNIIGGTRLRLDLDNDSPLDGGWLLSGRDGDEYIVQVTRWNDEASRYFSCETRIDERDLSLTEEILNICLSARPDWSTW